MLIALATLLHAYRELFARFSRMNERSETMQFLTAVSEFDAWRFRLCKKAGWLYSHHRSVRHKR